MFSFLYQSKNKSTPLLSTLGGGTGSDNGTETNSSNPNLNLHTTKSMSSTDFVKLSRFSCLNFMNIHHHHHNHHNKQHNNSHRTDSRNSLENLSKMYNLDSKVLQHYYEAFRLFDKNNDGSITMAEIETVMHSLGIHVTSDELAALIDGVDENDNGSIEFHEFLRLMVHHLNVQSDDNDDDIKHAFDVFDTDKDGYISSNELSSVMKNLGETMSDFEISSLIKEADKDGDGKVNFEEFQAMLDEPSQHRKSSI